MESSDFILNETDDLNEIEMRDSQIWDVTITSSIRIPNDNSEDSSYTDLESTIAFSIEALNPCLGSSIDPFSLD